ncbi:MAG TPA: type II toxin-antitoxin system HicB family antitoxin, partial [Allocoleopsis sp.]
PERAEALLRAILMHFRSKLKMNWNHNQNRFSFPIILTPDLTDGGYVVTFPDLPEAITQGEKIEDCLKEATDCLEEAIALRIDEQLDLPLPSEIKSNYVVELSLQMCLKAALYLKCE